MRWVGGLVKWWGCGVIKDPYSYGGRVRIQTSIFLRGSYIHGGNFEQFKVGVSSKVSRAMGRGALNVFGEQWYQRLRKGIAKHQFRAHHQDLRICLSAFVDSEGKENQP